MPARLCRPVFAACLAAAVVSCGAPPKSDTAETPIQADVEAAPAATKTEQPTAEPVAAEAGPCPEGMELMSAGTFQMGSNDHTDGENPVHEASVGAFCIDKTEVTVASYRSCVSRGSCPAPAWPPAHLTIDEVYEQADEFLDAMPTCNWDKPGRDNHPINCRNWDDSKTYCASVGKRLPTETEWEYAACGSESREYPWGSAFPSPSLLHASRRMYPDLGFGDELQTVPVGSFPKGATPEGVLDLAGNIAEWTSSPFCPYPSKVCSITDSIVIRGGSFDRSAGFVRRSFRNSAQPSERTGYLGFRCVKDVPK